MFIIRYYKFLSFFSVLLIIFIFLIFQRIFCSLWRGKLLIDYFRFLFSSSFCHLTAPKSSPKCWNKVSHHLCSAGVLWFGGEFFFFHNETESVLVNKPKNSKWLFQMTRTFLNWLFSIFTTKKSFETRWTTANWAKSIDKITKPYLIYFQKETKKVKI